jgi:hypothetical protein
MNTKEIKWGWVIVLIFFGFLAIGSLGIIGKILETIPPDIFVPEIVLTIVLLSGIVAFVAVLAIAVAVFAALGLSDSSQAFGMPEGTIRAVIALSLILIFAITAMFLYGQLRSPDTATVTGLTQAQLNAIPGDEIVASRPSEEGTNLFDVVRIIRSQTSDDFAKQILTTVSTLVVAVAGFYFGSRAVAAAKEAVTRPTLRIVRPDSPAKMTKDMTVLAIRLATEPAGLAIIGRVNGQVDEALKQTQHDEFEYHRPAVTPSGPIVLTFALAAQPEVTQTLQVQFVEESPA